MKTLPLVVLGVSAVVVLAGCTTPATGGDTDEPIVIGMPVGLSGLASGLDGPFLSGAQLAVDQINEDGGVLGRDLKIETADTKSDPAQAGTAAQQLIDDGADFILPTVDYDLGGPAARVAQTAGLISMTLAGDTRFGATGIGNLAFNISAGGANEGAAAATFAQEQGWTNPYFLEDTSLGYSTSFCKYARESWSAKSGTPVDQLAGDTFLNSDASIAAQISRLSEASPAPDFIVLCSYPPGGAAAVKQLRASGIDVPIVTGVAFDGTFWLETVPDENNLYVMGSGLISGTDPNADRAAFFEAYAESTGSPAVSSAWPLAGYSAVQALAKAIEAAGTTDSAEVAAQLETFKDEPLVIGPTTWTKDCHVSVDRPNVVLKITGGAEEYVSDVKPTDIPDAVC